MPSIEDDAIAIESAASERSEENVMSLRYIDYICGHKNMALVIKAVEKRIGIPIELIEAPNDMSGPREEHAISMFANGHVDIGRV